MWAGEMVVAKMTVCVVSRTVEHLQPQTEPWFGTVYHDEVAVRVARAYQSLHTVH